MNKVEIDLPPRLLKKIKVLGVLSDKRSSIEGLLVKLLDDVVSKEIDRLLYEGDELGAESLVKTGAYLQPISDNSLNQPPTNIWPGNKPVLSNPDITELSDGLGDEDPGQDETPITEADFAGLPRAPSGGITDEMLDNDMKVEDPDKEAAADAGTFADYVQSNIESTPEDLFARISGIGGEGEARTTGRKRRSTGRRGKVSAFTGHEETGL